MSLDEWLKLSQIVGPILTAALASVAAIYAARAKAKQEADTKWRTRIENDMAEVRKRTHEHARQFQGLPTTLEPFFVTRRESDKTEKSGDQMHESLEQRIAALEARR